jgi:hypothetical protein
MTFGSFNIDAEAGHEALVAENVDGDLLRVDVEEADLGVLGGIAHLGLGIGADQEAGLEVVGGHGLVSGVDRIERGVEGDHEDAGVTRLLDESERWPWCSTG